MAGQYAARLGVLLGLDTAELTVGVDKGIAETKRLNRAIENEMKAAEKEVLRIKNAVEDYGKEVSAVTIMQRKLAQGGMYENIGKSQKAYADALLKEAAALDAVAAADKKMQAGRGGAGGMDRYLKQALAYQTTDIITSLAGGQNPLMVLLQQGGQLRDQFGGFGPLFRGIAEAVTLSKVAFVGAGAAVAGLAFAAYQGSKEFAKLRDDMILTNNYAGVTAGSFDKMAASLSDKLNLAIGDTKDIFGALVASGSVTRGNLEVIATTIGKVSQLSGEAAETVAQRLLPSFDGTAASAAKLNNAFHFLNLQQYKQIELLEKAGKKQEAAKLTAELLNKTLEEQTRNLGYLEKGWIGVTNGLSSFWNKLKDIGKDDTTEKALEKIDAKIKSLQGPNTFGESQTARQMRLNDAIKERQELQSRLEQENKKALEKEKLAKDKAAIDLYSGAGGASKASEIEFNIRKQAIDKLYQDSLFNATEMEKVQVESAKRIAEKTLEIEKQNAEEKYQFSSQRYQELRNFVLMEESKAAQERQKINRDEIRVVTERQTAEKNALDMEKQKMGVYQENIFLTETEAKIAEKRLETAQKVARIVSDPKLTDDAKRVLIAEQEAIGKTGEEIIMLGEKIQYLRDINAAVFSSMTSAIEAFLITGKFNFANFTVSILANLIKIQAQMMAMTAMRGFGSIFGSMFGNIGTAMTYGTDIGSQQTAMLAAQDAGFRAAGGMVSENSPYIVGENGPELFIPNGSGTIIPNQRMNDFGGGGVTHITNNYIDAIDTKSFEDRLYGSSKAVWAANQYGNKNISTSRMRT